MQISFLDLTRNALSLSNGQSCGGRLLSLRATFGERGNLTVRGHPEPFGKLRVNSVEGSPPERLGRAGLHSAPLWGLQSG